MEPRPNGIPYSPDVSELRLTLLKPRESRLAVLRPEDVGDTGITFGRSADLSLRFDVRETAADPAMNRIVGRFTFDSGWWWVENVVHPEGREKPLINIATVGPTGDDDWLASRLDANSELRAHRYRRLDEPFIHLFFPTLNYDWKLRCELQLPEHPLPADLAVPGSPGLGTAVPELTRAQREVCAAWVRPLRTAQQTPSIRDVAATLNRPIDDIWETLRTVRNQLVKWLRVPLDPARLAPWTDPRDLDPRTADRERFALELAGYLWQNRLIPARELEDAVLPAALGELDQRVLAAFFNGWMDGTIPTIEEVAHSPGVHGLLRGNVRPSDAVSDALRRSAKSARFLLPATFASDSRLLAQLAKTAKLQGLIDDHLLSGADE